MNRKLRAALEAMTVERAPIRGTLTERLQAAIDPTDRAGIDELAAELAKGGSAVELRSTATRILLRKGAEAMLAEANSQA